MVLHDAADQRARIVVDDATASGLTQFASRARGVYPRTIDPWRRAAAPAFIARPAIGVFALLAACGLAIFVGATELSWGAVLPTGSAGQSPHPAAALPPKVAAVDPARAAVLSRVAGPGIGLMIAGLIGFLFLPVVLALAAIPAWTLTPLPSESHSRGPLEFLDGPVPVPTAPPGFLLGISPPQLPSTLSITGLAPSAPLLVAQADTMTHVGLMAPFALLFMIFNLAFSVMLIVGGWRMRQLKSYGLAVIAAVLAMLPCTFGWLIGLPIGIWAFSTLARNEVRDAFES